MPMDKGDTYNARVLEMKFNNEDFEKNIQQSIDSLNTFQDTLDNLHGGKAVDQISKSINAVDLSKIESGIEKLKERMSTLGIIGASVIYRLTNSFLNFGRSLWDISLGQMQAGGWNRALNIQQAEFMLKGLGLDVAQIRDDALFAVKGTAYGFDEAANAAAAFGASGVKAGEDMQKALLGVAGTAAMTGASFAEISDIFTTVASNGRVMHDQISRLSYRGLNAAAVLGKQLGKTEAQIHAMVSKGQIDFKTFSKAMSDAFADHAKDANKTFSGAMSNIRAALSRIGAEFASPIVNDTIPALNSLMQLVDAIHESMSPVIDLFSQWYKIAVTLFDGILQKTKESKAFSNIFEGLKNIFVAFVTVLYAAKKGFEAAFPQFKDLSNAFRLLSVYLIPTQEGFDGLVNIFKIFFASIKVVIDAMKVVAKGLVVAGILGYKFLEIIIGLASGIGDLIDPYIKWIKENNVIENILYIVVSVIYEMIEGSELLKKSLQNLTGDWSTLKGFFDNIAVVIKNALQYIANLIGAFDITQVATVAFVALLAFAAEEIWQFVNRIYVTFGGFLFTIYNIFKQIGNVFSNLSKVFKQLAHLFAISSLELIAGIILKTAAAIFVLSVALKILASISTEDLIKAGVAFLVLAGGLVGLAAAFNGLYGKDGLGKLFGAGAMATTFLAIAVSMTILTVAIRAIGAMDKESIFRAVATIVAIGVLLTVLSKLISSTSMQVLLTKDKFAFQSFSIKVFAIAASMALLSLSVRMLSGIESGLGKALGALTVMAIIITAVAKITSVADKNKQLIHPSLFSQLSLSMLMLSVAIRILADIDNPRSLDDALGALTYLTIGILLISHIQTMMEGGTIETSGFLQLAATLSILTACLVALTLCAAYPNNALTMGVNAIFKLGEIMLIMSAIQKIIDSGAIETKGFIWFAATLTLLTGCLVTISTLVAICPPGVIETGLNYLAALGLFMLAFGAVQKMFDFGGINSSGLIKFAFTITLLSSALTVLSLLDVNNIGDALAAMVELSALVMVMMYLSRYLDGIASSGFVAFSAAILILSGAVVVLCKSMPSDPSDLLLAVVAIGVLAGITYQFVKMSQDMKSIHTFGFITFATSILILVGAVALLTLLPDDTKMFNAAAAIMGLVVVMGIVAKTAQNFNVSAALGLAILAGGVLVLAGAMVLLANVPWDKLLISMGTVMLLLVALSAISAPTWGIDPRSAAAIAILAGSVLVLSASLLILSNIPWNVLLVGTACISLLTAVLVICAHSVTAAIPGLLSLAATFVSIGLSMLGFGLGVKLVADGFMTFTNALHNLATLSKEDVVQILNNISDLCDGIVGLAPKLALAAGALGLALGAALGVISVSLSSFAVLGIILFAYMLVASAPILLDAFGQLMDATGVWFDEHEDQVYEFGEHVGKVFMDGVLGGLTGISEAIYDKTFGAETQEYIEQMAEIEKGAMSKGAENMIEWMDMYNAGQTSAEQMVAGLKAGLENGYMTQEEVSRELAARGLESFNAELGIHSPSRAFEASGMYSVAGYVQGLAKGEKPLNDSMTLLAKGGVESFNDEMGIHSNSDVMIESGEYTVGGLIEGVMNGEVPLLDAMSALGANATNAFTSQFNTSTLMGGLGGTKTNEWEEKGMTWVAGDYAYKRAGFDTLEDYVAEMESRERMRPYNEFMSQFQSNPTEDMSKGIEDLTKNLGGFSNGMGTAAKKTDELNNAIKSSLNVFSKFDDQVSTTGRTVLDNFMSQIKGVSKWAEELKVLSTRGLNANFLVDLADSGPEAYDKIHALYTMTDKELSLFNHMYAQKLSLQKSTAKEIRNSFVKNGAMTEKEAAEYGKKIAEATASGVESGSGAVTDSMTKTETQAVKDAAEEAKRQKIDDAFISQWANGVASSSSKLTMSQAFTDLGLASMDAFKQSMNFEVILDQLIVFKNGIKDQVRSALNLFDEVTYKTNEQKKAEEKSTQQMVYNMIENTKKIGRWATNIQRLSERGLSEGLVDQLRQLGPEGADTIDAFVRMSDKELKKVNSVYASSLKLDEYTSDKITSAYSKAGFATALGLKKGLNEGKDDLLFAYQETGADASEGFANGIDPNAAREAMKYLGENSLAELKTALDSHSPSKETEKIGQDTTEGYIIGIESPSRLAEAISKLATTTLGLFTQLMGPDKFRIMGLECIDGFARGILEGLEMKTRDILNMFTLGMFGMNENLEDPDNSLRVNIIPVVDQTALDGTSSLMNEYFGNKRFDISATVNRANAANKTNNPDSDKNLIVEAIRGLREDIRNIKNVNEGYRTDIGSLRDAITSMKVTLDTGALVGQITNPLDAALGTKAVRSLRRRG